MLKLFIILPCLLLKFQPLNAKVEAPNYSFNNDTFEDFMPGRPLKELNKKFGTPEEMTKNFQVRTLKYYVSNVRYKFPVLVQEQEGVILDFHARLPSYFLHDTFFKGLRDKLGKQDSYKKTGEEAYYTWEKPPLRHIYSAACTITCFPIFYAVQKIESEEPSINEKMKKANLTN